MAFLDQQISAPYNQSIRKVKATLQGIRSDLCHTDRLLFNFVKQDVLAIIQPLTKVLQESEIILPALFSSCQRSIKVIGKLGKLLDAQGVEAFSNTEIFSSTANMLQYLQPNEEEVIPQRATRNATRENPTNSHSLFHDFLMSGNIEGAKERVLGEFKSIVDGLHKSLQSRLGPIMQEAVFAAIAIFLDSESYRHIGAETIKINLDTIVNRFRSLLEANNCEIEKLHSEFETVFDHVNLFLPNVSPSKVWPNLFMKQKELNIENIIHVAEICIAVPLSNAETERVFSFLWKVFAKERQSLKNRALENTLILRCDTNTSPERYSHAIDLFLSVNPSGQIRKGSRRTCGYQERHAKVRRKNNTPFRSPTSAIEQLVSSEEDETEDEAPNVEEISCDDWTSSDEDL